jgi:hypothetical protein
MSPIRRRTSIVERLLGHRVSSKLPHVTPGPLLHFERQVRRLHCRWRFSFLEQPKEKRSVAVDDDARCRVWISVYVSGLLARGTTHATWQHYSVERSTERKSFQSSDPGHKMPELDTMTLRTAAAVHAWGMEQFGPPPFTGALFYCCANKLAFRPILKPFETGATPRARQEPSVSCCWTDSPSSPHVNGSS